MTVDEYVYIKAACSVCYVVLPGAPAHRKGLGQHASRERKWKAVIGPLQRS